MSDEEILLAAIAANPKDDGPRLAYADWLQENGFDDKAEFVRMEYQYRRSKARLRELRTALDEKWMEKIVGYGRVVLLSYPSPAHKIATIKIIRELTGVGLAEAKTMSESLPCAITRPMSHEQAEPIMQRFRDIGAEAELRFEPPE